MNSTLNTLRKMIDRLDSPDIKGTDVISCVCPVPVFGDLSSAQVATLGINPSDQEFFDKGKQLDGKFRRFPTLASLGLESWSKADTPHWNEILDSCRNYFSHNPYDRWFKPVDAIVQGANHASYYGVSPTACHLDLVPYATKRKWCKLRSAQKQSLLDISRCTLGELLRDSPVEILILNGKSVVGEFEKFAETSLESREMPEWQLRPESDSPVKGVAYWGPVDSLSGIKLGREISVLGYNHYPPDPHAKFDQVSAAIKKWIAQRVQKKLSTNRRSHVAVGRAAGG